MIETARSSTGYLETLCLREIIKETEISLHKERSASARTRIPDGRLRFYWKRSDWRKHYCTQSAFMNYTTSISSVICVITSNHLQHPISINATRGLYNLGYILFCTCVYKAASKLLELVNKLLQERGWDAVGRLSFFAHDV